MPLMQKKTPEQRAEDVRIREQRQHEAEAQKRAEQVEKEAYSAAATVISTLSERTARLNER